MTKKKVDAKRLGDVESVKNMQRKFAAAARYNHVRVQFPSGEEKHLLFTDWQIKRGLERARKNPEDLPKVTWIRDMIDEVKIFDTQRLADLQEVINSNNLPVAAKKYNHIRVVMDGEEHHLLFTDNDIIVALERADKNPEDLPKVSWLKDIFD